MREEYATLSDYNASIRGKTLIDPHHIANFTDILRDKFGKMMDALTNTNEDRYVMGMADPFHPDVQGTRVPELVPRETLTYTAFTEAPSIPTAAGEVILIPFHPMGDT